MAEGNGSGSKSEGPMDPKTAPLYFLKFLIHFLNLLLLLCFNLLPAWANLVLAGGYLWYLRKDFRPQKPLSAFPWISLFILSFFILSSVKFGYCLLNGFHTIAKKDPSNRSYLSLRPSEVMTLIGVVIVLFYGIGRGTGQLSPFFNPYLRDHPPYKLILFLIQELLPFVVVWIFLRIKDLRYAMLIFLLLGLSLVGGPDMLMSSSVLVVFYMIYEMARSADFGRRKTVVTLVVLALLCMPNLISIGVEIPDVRDENIKGLFPREARGRLAIGRNKMVSRL